MRFMRYFLLIFSVINPMENPAPQLVRKYSCCPEKFGYRFIKMNDQVEGCEDIILADFEESKECSDDMPVRIKSCLFKRLLIELKNNPTVQAQESRLRLIDRITTGRIVVGDEYTQLSQKDMSHRFFANFSGRRFQDDITMTIQGQVVRPFFLEGNFCIHEFKSILSSFEHEHQEMLFGEEVSQKFKEVRPFPSLLALASRVITENQITGSVPQDLQGLIKR